MLLLALNVLSIAESVGGEKEGRKNKPEGKEEVTRGFNSCQGLRDQECN